jgi:hypothetical protein
MAVAALVPRLPATASRAGTVRDKTAWTFTRAVRMAGLGTVRRGVSVAPAALTGTLAGLVTKRGDGHAHRSMALSGQRWPSDTLYQAGTMPLGLDEDRRRHAAAMGTQWCLGCVASARVPLDGLPPSPTQGSFPLTTLGEACRQQAQALLEALLLEAHARLHLGQRAEALLASVCAKQQPAMARG